MKFAISLILGLVVSAAAFADCGGVCRPGPATPPTAYAACQMVNSFPLNIRADTCVNANGCVWNPGQEVAVCVPGPATPPTAYAACQMVNSFPLDIRYDTCINANGCVVQQTCN